MDIIPFNKPFLTGNETNYIKEAVVNGHLSGNGTFTKKCHEFFSSRYKFQKCLLTTSCTDALEMCALLLDIQPGDEVIVPSYTFVSSALAFTRQGAKIIFADSTPNNPNIDIEKIETLITTKTKAIVVVHYAGIACDMDKIMAISEKYKIKIIEDAAQAIDSYYKDKPLGSIGHLATFSFHETKNIISGEGGLLIINDPSFNKRSEIIWEKGTNRSEFFRGEVNKYGWVDTGSSFLPSEIISAFLFSQLENIDKIQQKRIKLWNEYNNNLEELEKNGYLKRPVIPYYATNNAHIYYIICNSNEERSALINYLKKNNIIAVFHYLSLHTSKYYTSTHPAPHLPNCDKFANCLLRLPLYYELSITQIKYICSSIKNFFYEQTQGPIISNK